MHEDLLIILDAYIRTFHSCPGLTYFKIPMMYHTSQGDNVKLNSLN